MDQAENQNHPPTNLPTAVPLESSPQLPTKPSNLTLVYGLLAFLLFSTLTFSSFLILKTLSENNSPQALIADNHSINNETIHVQELPVANTGDVGAVAVTPDQTRPSFTPATSSPQTQQFGSGVPLIGNKVGFMGNAVATRNLAGMLVQINQIDSCKAPEISIFSTVTDKNGGVFAGINSTDFTVSLDSQPVTNFNLTYVKNEDIPLNAILVLDHSGSMKGEPLTRAKESAISFIDQLKANDQVGLIQFDTQIELIQALTTKKELVKNQINSIVARSDTALYDVVYFAAENSPGCGRKAIILLTDGRDTASKNYTLNKALEKANLVNVPAFVVGLKSYQFTPEVLQRIAEGTGAQYFEAPTPQDLVAMYQKISDQLRGQYVFKFNLQIPKNGSEHRIKVSSNVGGSQTTSEKSFIY